MKSQKLDIAYQLALDEISTMLQGDIDFIRTLEYAWVYTFEYSSKSVSFTYGLVRYPPDSGSILDSIVLLTDRPLWLGQRRFLAGFHLGKDDTVSPMSDELLAEIGD
jgi:hypothetical protein